MVDKEKLNKQIRDYIIEQYKNKNMRSLVNGIRKIYKDIYKTDSFTPHNRLILVTVHTVMKDYLNNSIYDILKSMRDNKYFKCIDAYVEHLSIDNKRKMLRFLKDHVDHG